MPRLLTIAAPMAAAGALLAPNCGGCDPGPGPAPQNTGMVWFDTEDPTRVNQPAETQPTFDYGDPADPTQVRVNMVLSIDPDVDGSLGDLCAESIDYWAAEFGTAPETECLYIELAVDVSASEPTDLVLFNGPVTRPDDRFIDLYFWGDPIAPGDSSGVGAFFPGGQPGSTTQWFLDTVDEQALYDGFWDVPEAAQFAPVTWNPDIS